MGWMLRGVRDGDRAFVGRDAIRRELVEKTSRWATVGVVVDWADWDRLHREAGLLTVKDEHPLPYESMLYDGDGAQVGYATSLMYSQVLQRHIGIARVRPALSAPGTPLRLETSLLHHNTTVAASTTALPHFNPPRKTANA
jgi:aminomethyltransferase